jgi:hypothetical protein
MRLVTVPVCTMAARPEPRATLRAGRPVPLSNLPGAVADRLADLLALDPGLAEAVSARLPAARAASARDLAAYAQPVPGRTIDIRS